MSGDWKSKLSTFGRKEEFPNEAKASVIVNGLTITVGDIITIREPSEKVFLPSGVVNKDLKVQSIDPAKRIIIFEGYEHPLHADIADSGLVTLAKSGGQEKKTIRKPQAGDQIILASNYGPILMITDEQGAPINGNRSESAQKLNTGAIVEQVLDGEALIVRSQMRNDKRRFLITFSNKVRVIQKK